MTVRAPELGSGALREFLRDAFEHSTVVSSVRAHREASRRTDWRRTSTALELIGRSGRVTSAAATSSVAARSGRLLGEWIKAAAIYRWLTKEPEPEAIVIDLRETVTAGPIIAGLDRLGDSLRPAVRRSRLVQAAVAAEMEFRRRPVRTASWAVLVGTIITLGLSLLGGLPTPPEFILHAALLALAALGTRVTTPWAELRDARTIRLLAAVLEPPEPVDQTARTTDDGERRVTETDQE